MSLYCPTSSLVESSVRLALVGVVGPLDYNVSLVPWLGVLILGDSEGRA